MWGIIYGLILSEEPLFLCTVQTWQTHCFFPWSSLKILAFCGCLHPNLLPITTTTPFLYVLGFVLFHWRDSKPSGFRHHRSANVSKVSDCSAGLLLRLLFLSSWGTEDSPEFLESSALPVSCNLSIIL